MEQTWQNVDNETECVYHGNMNGETRRCSISQDGRPIAVLETVGATTTVRLLTESYTPEDLQALAEGFHLAAVAARRSRSSNGPWKEAVLAALSSDPKMAVRLRDIQDLLKITRPTADKIVSELVKEKKVNKRILYNRAGQPVFYWLA
jgi:hypothetical protein